MDWSFVIKRFLVMITLEDDASRDGTTIYLYSSQ